LVAGKKGKMYHFEAFWLDFAPIAGYHSQSAIVALKYAPGENGIVSVSTDGEIVFLPFVHD
jgi:hypothetical protein